MLVSLFLKPSDYRNGTHRADDLDKQYTYYTLKVLENLSYISNTRTSIMQKQSKERSVIEDVRLSDWYEKLPFEDFEFWEVYYRHNNYFLERNTSLLHQIKDNKNFLQASVLNNNSIGFEQFIEFYDHTQNCLSHIRIRVCSLMDIIKMETALGMTQTFLNTSVKNIVEKFQANKEAVERVFRASEETMSVLLYKPEERKLISRTDALKKVLPFLNSRDGLSLIRLNKKTYGELREHLIGLKLATNDRLGANQETRLQMWLSMVPRVSMEF